MNSTHAQYWKQKLKSAYESSQWSDAAGVSFGDTELPEMLEGLSKLGDVGDSVEVFIKKAEELLRS